MSDVAAPLPAEVRSEWEVLTALCRRLGERVAARGLQSYTDRNGMAHRYDQFRDNHTLNAEERRACMNPEPSSATTGGYE